MDNQQPQQMPASQQASVPGEASISPQQVQQVAPDTQGMQGQAQMLAKLTGAHKIKLMLDGAFTLAAEHTGATFSSRVKDPETIQKKIVQKRLENRDYDLDDIRDAYGGRFTVDNSSDIPKVKKQIEDMAKIGLFKIVKEEKRAEGTYNAYHYDIKVPDGHTAELQVHTAQSEAEAVSNHSLRAVYGEKPNNKAVEALKQKQAAIATSLPNDKARAVTQALQGITKQQGNQPLSPQTTASVLAQAQQ